MAWRKKGDRGGGGSGYRAGSGELFSGAYLKQLLFIRSYGGNVEVE
jgi:hypothetical protein